MFLYVQFYHEHIAMTYKIIGHLASCHDHKNSYCAKDIGYIGYFYFFNRLRNCLII